MRFFYAGDPAVFLRSPGNVPHGDPPQTPTRPFSAAGSRPARTDLSPSGHAPLHDPGVSLPAADVLLCKRRFLRRYCKARQCNALSPVHAARKRLPRRRCVQWGTLWAVSARKNRYSRAGNPGYCKKMRLYPHLRASGIRRLFRNRAGRRAVHLGSIDPARRRGIPCDHGDTACCVSHRTAGIRLRVSGWVLRAGRRYPILVRHAGCTGPYSGTYVLPHAWDHGMCAVGIPPTDGLRRDPGGTRNRCYKRKV